MNAFVCGVCGLKSDIKDMCLKWGYNPQKKEAAGFIITHAFEPCINHYFEKSDFLNRKLELEYVFKNMPEFIYYMRRLKINERELKAVVNEIEKGRSYIRRFNVIKKEVKKLIIMLEGSGSKDGMC